MTIAGTVREGREAFQRIWLHLGLVTRGHSVMRPAIRKVELVVVLTQHRGPGDEIKRIEFVSLQLTTPLLPSLVSEL